MQVRKIITKSVKLIAVIASTLTLLVCVFDFQYSLLTGPFIDVLLLSALTLIGLVFSLALIPLNGFGKLTSYLPLSLIIVAFSLTFLISSFNVGHELHYLMNKKNLESIDELSQKAGIFEITDMLRYQKRLNDDAISNNLKYTNREKIENAFGNYIREQHLNLDQINELRDRLEDSNLISLNRTDNYLILTVDGFVDNEYGYVKTSNKELKVGETLPPFGFIIVRLIEFGDGWYFFYTT